MTDADPILELAGRIRAEVERIAADPSLHPNLLQELFDDADRDERAGIARSVFDALAPEQQWDVLERLFGDDELRAYLHHVRSRAATALDTRVLRAGDELVLGLFREDDVHAALRRGHRSTSAARQLTLRSLGGGDFLVTSDVFNPGGGYFVTRDYDESAWRDEKLDGHARVRVGSITNDGFEPVLHPGGRVDVRLEVGDVRGQLFLGFATVRGAGVFSS